MYPDHVVKRIFLVSLLTAMLWLAFAFYFDLAWIASISNYLPYPLALLIVLGIAVLPGFTFAFLFLTLLQDKRRFPAESKSYPDLTILIAAYNEERYLETTIRKVMENYYSGKIEVIVINDGSTDQTSAILHRLEKEFSQLLVLEHVQNKGKAAALNFGLAYASYRYIVTVDADTWLHPRALSEIVKPFFESKQPVGAVAGSMMVANEKESWLTRLQVWEYLVSIAAVKRQQSLYHGTLVAQGAFSAYLKKAVEQTGGWPNVLGEDIVLTWGMLKNGYRVCYTPRAIAFTHVPFTLAAFTRQRKRWARGMLEGFQNHPDILTKYKGLSRINIFSNLFFPFIDLMVVCAVIPGLFLALYYQNYLIVGPLTFLVLPLSVSIIWITYSYNKRIFIEMDIPVSRNLPRYVLFLLTFPLLQAPIRLIGYLEELFDRQKHW